MAHSHDEYSVVIRNHVFCFFLESCHLVMRENAHHVLSGNSRIQAICSMTSFFIKNNQRHRKKMGRREETVPTF